MVFNTSLPAVLRTALDGSQPLETIPVLSTPAPPVELKNFATVGTYSYMDADKPTLLIPSAPPVERVNLPTRVPQDRGHSLIDGNALKMPKCPLEPALQTAALLAASKVSFSSLDLVVDRNSIRKLYGLVSNKGQAFRLDAELVGDKTMLLTRCDESLWDDFAGFKGYAENCRERQTIEVGELRDAAFDGLCWRLSRYDLGPLSILIRYEADAQMAVQGAATTSAEAPVSVPDLANLVAKISLDSSSSTRTITRASSALSYALTKIPIPAQSRMMEIKTRPAHKEFDPTSFWDQLFFSQTQHLWLATYLKSGTFPAANLSKWELDKGVMKDFGVREGMTAIARVVRLLQEMQKTVIKYGKRGEGVSFVVEPGTAGLQVWKTKEGHRRRLVGEEVKALFA